MGPWHRSKQDIGLDEVGGGRNDARIYPGIAVALGDLGAAQVDR